MVPDTLLAILRCPEDHSKLARAEPHIVEAVNRRIEAGQARNRAGRTLDRPIDEGLIREKGDVLYPVVDGIPRLLVDEGIQSPQLEVG